MVKHEEILDALETRGPWEKRQATWYQMRHDGLRRRNKPWPNAADMHFPLGDMMIEKMKPFYVSQVFATDTIASFTGLSSDAAAQQSGAAQWFDYQLKQCSNFEDEIVIGSDKMLEGGKGVLKVYWDTQAKQLCFEAINPIYVIVPAHTGRLAKADWIVHVQHYSKAAYKRLKHFKTDETTLTMLCSEGADAAGARAAEYEQKREEREGLTKGRTKDQIVIWEVFSRKDDGQWEVATYSPVAPTTPLRADFGLPYNKGIFGEPNPPPPFFDLSCEKKDRGYYDARGLIERVAAFEASLCKDWNTQKDYQTLVCSPMFHAKGTVPNNANLRMVPGQILPFELNAVQMPPIPMDIAQGMIGTRGTAEQLIGTPDFGMGQNQTQDKPKTAKEAGIIANVMGQNVDLRARIFRRELGHGLNLAWSILIQYAREQLQYFFLDELQALAANVFDHKYRIEPNGSGDNFNRGFVVQKAQARFQMLNNDPFIQQYELRRSLLDADDPRLTKKLLVDAGTQQAEQLEDQAQEITIMLLGFPAQVRPTDDDLAHFQSLAGFVQRRAQMGEELSAETLALISQHAQGHASALQHKKPDVWKREQQKLMFFLREIGSAAQAAQQQQAAMQQQKQQAQHALLQPGAAV